MFSTDSEYIVCDAPGGCDQKIRNFTWDKLKAEEFGWIINKKGIAFCPEHRWYVVKKPKEE